MALRCERCRTSDLRLVSFGIYDCPTCGRVDADGNILSEGGSAREDHTDPNILDTGRASFVAPPPAAAGSMPALTPVGTRELPSLFLATVAVLGLLDVAEAVQSRSPIGLVLQAGTMVALLTGKRWARTLAIAGAVLVVGLAAMLFVFVHGAAPYGLVCGIVIGANAWWLYVLFRPDTVAYFSR